MFSIHFFAPNIDQLDTFLDTVVFNSKSGQAQNFVGGTWYAQMLLVLMLHAFSRAVRTLVVLPSVIRLLAEKLEITLAFWGLKLTVVTAEQCEKS